MNRASSPKQGHPVEHRGRRPEAEKVETPLRRWPLRPGCAPRWPRLLLRISTAEPRTAANGGGRRFRWSCPGPPPRRWRRSRRPRRSARSPARHRPGTGCPSRSRHRRRRRTASRISTGSRIAAINASTLRSDRRRPRRPARPRPRARRASGSARGADDRVTATAVGWPLRRLTAARSGRLLGSAGCSRQCEDHLIQRGPVRREPLHLDAPRRGAGRAGPARRRAAVGWNVHGQRLRVLPDGYRGRGAVAAWRGRAYRRWEEELRRLAADPGP